MRSRSWVEDLPGRLARELAEMRQVAPDLMWSAAAGEWAGLAPIWPFERPSPPNLHEFLAGDRFELVIRPSPAHPAVPPAIWPMDPRTELVHCTDTAWHTNGDGSLCVVREHYTWTGSECCAALVPRAAGWFLEFLLMSAGMIEDMTVQGIETSTELDHLFVPESRRVVG